ncbi:unnamed protein product [Periconia digitata]|uniref:Uncharacterized protein n=1 Tax=Periconia digitata TaxID=1303443 RepID=A0A9W4U2W4_9PLEO|nr:unnamed protein product [Periconia digitata]
MMNPVNHDTMEEPPPPYQELADPLPIGAAELPAVLPAELPDARANSHPRFSAAIEYSPDNSPQLIVNGEGFPAPQPPPRNPARLHSRLHSDSGRGIGPGLHPMPVRPRPQPSRDSLKRKPLPSSAISQRHSNNSASSLTSTKAREAGFEIEEEPRPLAARTASSASSEPPPSVTILPSSKPLKFTRESGKVTAYLVPFPKPSIKGVNVEDIPDRFLIYTPPVPPLAKPVPGEKETHWHKTQRQWQEEVRKATVQRASKSSWQGLKAGTSNLVLKGVNKTKSTSLEFLERASGDTDLFDPEEDEVVVKKTDTIKDDDKVVEAAPPSPPSPPPPPTLTTTDTPPQGGAVELPTEAPTLTTAELPADNNELELQPDTTPNFSNTTNTAADKRAKGKSKSKSKSKDKPKDKNKSKSKEKDKESDKEKEKEKEKESKPPKGLSDLTLIYPPTLALTPQQIRAEFGDTLLRISTSSRKDALLASTLVPFAAGLDATLLFTLGGFTQMTSAWAYTSTRGALESRKMTKAISRGDLLVKDDDAAADENDNNTANSTPTLTPSGTGDQIKEKSFIGDAEIGATSTRSEIKGTTPTSSPPPILQHQLSSTLSLPSTTTSTATAIATATAAATATATPQRRPPLQKDEKQKSATSSTFSFDSSTISKFYTPKEEKDKPSTALHLQESTHLEPFQRYLELACMKTSFALFPHVEEVSDDVNESSVLDAIGWKPVVQRGVDNEVESQDIEERYQREEAREDVKRMVRKGAAEWVSWCKTFAKDSEAAGKK